MKAFRSIATILGIASALSATATAPERIESQPNPTPASLKKEPKTKARREFFRKGKRSKYIGEKRFYQHSSRTYSLNNTQRSGPHPGEPQDFLVIHIGPQEYTAVTKEMIPRPAGKSTQILALNSKNAIRKARNAGFIPQFNF